ncbi:MAG: ATP-binding cassette domain-containing protein [Clostridia bacterium]|nr:ATP-binding cassette domain-containing protein [Clostridia bacterium]MDD4686298.1 ATP-binding cassette domain-containing protein [Clostridia bacterium]
MLELKNINYKVDSPQGKKPYILKNINLKMDYGKIIAITGQNGSGKTTLVKIIMGILKPCKDGEIFLDGVDITDLNVSERAQKAIAFAFQQPTKFKGLTVKTLLEVASNKKMNVDDICSYLSKVGLCARDYINRELDSGLSGGELKRIELALVLARNAKINIFDEPEAGIDLWSFDNLTDIFKELKQNGSLTIIVSHQEKILNLADEIILIERPNICIYNNSEKNIAILSFKDKCKRLNI